MLVHTHQTTRRHNKELHICTEYHKSNTARNALQNTVTQHSHLFAQVSNNPGSHHANSGTKHEETTISTVLLYLYYTAIQPFGAGIIFLILAHPVYKKLIIQEPNMSEL